MRKEKGQRGSIGGKVARSKAVEIQQEMKKKRLDELEKGEGRRGKKRSLITKAEIYNRLFHIKIYRNRTARKLRYILVQKQIVLNSFDITIEKLREKNHRRAVMIQCMQQNFGYSNLHTIENALIFKIDSYIH